MSNKPRTPFAKSLGAPTPKDYDQLVQRASELSGISMTDLLSSKRTQRVSQWRQAVFYVLRHKGASFPEIGKYFNRHHATIIHGCKNLDKNAANKTVQQIIIDLTKPSTNGDTNN
jgi:chromosomal replication initiation ATPase DnaA